jgi:hypothetical protein
VLRVRVEVDIEVRRSIGGVVRYYFGIELGVLAAVSAALLSIRAFGGVWVVVPLVVIAWVLLQLISSVAFCNAISKGDIAVSRHPLTSKETYRIAAGRKSRWLVMRHVWTYNLVSRT